MLPLLTIASQKSILKKKKLPLGKHPILFILGFLTNIVENTPKFCTSGCFLKI